MMTSEEKQIWKILEAVADPEIPVLSITDLGIIRGVHIIQPSHAVEVLITPTYSGCPAMDAISMNIRLALLQNGFRDIQIKSVLSPAWSSDWITEHGRQKLKAYGVAPPLRMKKNNTIELFAEPDTIQCPQCNSFDTSLISEFGSTACKALYRCNSCNEPFDHFKCH